MHTGVRRMAFLTVVTGVTPQAWGCCGPDRQEFERQGNSGLVFAGTVERLEMDPRAKWRALAWVRVDRVWKGTLRSPVVRVDMGWRAEPPGAPVYVIGSPDVDGVVRGGGNCTRDVGPLASAPNLSDIAGRRPDHAGTIDAPLPELAPTGGLSVWPAMDGHLAWARQGEELRPAAHIRRDLFAVKVDEFEVLEALAPAQRGRAVVTPTPVARGANLSWSPGVPVGVDGVPEPGPGVTGAVAVPETAVGDRWRPAHRRPVHGTSLLFDEPVSLFDRPNGRRLLEVAPGTVYLTADRVVDDAAWQRVTVVGTSLSGYAYVGRSTVRPGIQSYISRVSGRPWLCSGPSYTYLKAGALIRDEHGRIFARATALAEPQVVAETETTIWVSVETLSGWSVGWVLRTTE